MIDEVIPGSTAAAAGFKAGDILLALNGAKIAGAVAFIQAIASRKAGAELTIELRRGEDLRKEKVTLKGRPFEKSDAYEIIYGRWPAAPADCERSSPGPRERASIPPCS